MSSLRSVACEEFDRYFDMELKRDPELKRSELWHKYCDELIAQEKIERITREGKGWMWCHDLKCRQIIVSEPGSYFCDKCLQQQFNQRRNFQNAL